MSNDLVRQSPGQVAQVARPISGRQDDGKYLIDGARITFRNFAGKAGQYNAAGQRNFHIVLPEDVAQALMEDGFNVKARPPRNEGDDTFYHLKVNVKMDGRIPPKLHIVTSKGRRTLEEGMLEMIDWADFANVDLIFSRYKRDWPDGRTTVTAYLQTFFGTIREDVLEERYSDVPELESSMSAETWEPVAPGEINAEMEREMDVWDAEIVE